MWSSVVPFCLNIIQFPASSLGRIFYFEREIDNVQQANMINPPFDGPEENGFNLCGIIQKREE